MSLVGVIMGSDSDWPVMRAAAQALDEFGVAHEVSVVSAHRTPARMLDYARNAAGRGLKVIIAGAGGAAHLPGMVASATVLPVIGVPVPLAHLDGLDSLLSIVQMPAGVPVATVSVGGARNAGLLAVRILAASDPALAHRIATFQQEAQRAIPTGARRRSPALRAALDLRAAMYELGVEHEALREAVRDLADKEIAPYAAEVDEFERFPREAQAALVRAAFHAVHIPEAYGGQGADSVATCIVIEEVARVCASSSLIPAVNKLGTMGLLLAGSEQLREQVLPSLAAGSMASYALSEREAGSDAAAMRTRAQRDGSHWVLNGTKCWISNAGQSTWYTVMAVTDPDQGRSWNQRLRRSQRRPGILGWTQGAQVGNQG